MKRCMQWQLAGRIIRMRQCATRLRDLRREVRDHPAALGFTANEPLLPELAVLGLEPLEVPLLVRPLDRLVSCSHSSPQILFRSSRYARDNLNDTTCCMWLTDGTVRVSRGGDREASAIFGVQAALVRDRIRIERSVVRGFGCVGGTSAFRLCHTLF